MEYNDEAMPSLNNIEEMARAYSFSLKQKGFVFVSLEEEGKKFLIAEVFEILFKLRASYRYLKNFLGSSAMLSLTEEHIDVLRSMFDFEDNCGYFISCNQTKCFLNTVSLENQLNIKLLLLSQKCEFGEDLIIMLLDRSKRLSQNLIIENAISSKIY